MPVKRQSSSISFHTTPGHSTSGNPKRGWLITDDDGNFTDFVDEGYRGDPGALIHAGYKGIARTPQIDVAGNTYTETLRDANRKHQEQMKSRRTR